MNFNSVNYMIFLPIVVILYFNIPQKFKNIYLLAVSFGFYYVNETKLVFILPIMSALTCCFGIMIDRAEGKKRKNMFLLSLFVNIGTLVFFKYSKYFIAVFKSIFKVSFSASRVAFPMGISFFTLMMVGYLADVFMEKYSAEQDFIKFFAYICFFPHILMGPIDRANKFLPQLDEVHVFDYERVRRGLLIMGVGFFKKIAVADVLAKYIDAMHQDLHSYTGLMLLFTAVIYCFQLYGDFSGYSDIARGSAMIMGFDIMENFNTPYMATNFSSFWSRWHISLSSWFQDYIFTPFVWSNPLSKLPLVGKYFTKPPVLCAIAAVFITSGIWHGNTFNFVIWGILYTVYRIAEELMHRKFGKPKKKQKLSVYWGKVIVTFTFMAFAEIFFRCATVSDSVYYITHMFSGLSLTAFKAQLFSAIASGFDATPILMYAYIAYCMLVLAIMIFMDLWQFYKLKGKNITTAFDNMKPLPKWLCYYALIGLIMAGFILNNGGYGASASFIYNNF